MHKKLNTLLLVSLFLFVLTVSASIAEQEVIPLTGYEDEPFETSTILIDVPATYEYSVIKTPSHGTLSLFIPPNHLTYHPSSNYIGDDTFTVKIHIVYDDPDTPPDDWIGVYPVTIYPVNDYPIANPLYVFTMKNSPVSIELSGSDPVEGSSLTYFVSTFSVHGILSDASHGQITDQNDRTITYTPELDYVGDDSFGYVVFDGTDYSYEAIGKITVFDLETAHPVLIGTSSYFFRIIDAYASADADGTVIKLWGIEFVDGVLFEQDKQVTLEGGYNVTFTSNEGGMTSVPGPLTVKCGAATMENITIK